MSIKSSSKPSLLVNIVFLVLFMAAMNWLLFWAFGPTGYYMWRELGAPPWWVFIIANVLWLCAFVLP